MQWLMLQQESPEDYVIATGEQHSVQDFCGFAFAELGIGLRWQGDGLEKTGIVASVDTKKMPQGAGKKFPQVGDTVIRVDPRYFRPTEVETLLGDASKAREKLGWVPEIAFMDMVAEMVRKDLADAQRDALCRQEGFKTYQYHE